VWSKIVWMGLPLGLYAAYAGWSAWRRRPPKRRAVNMHTSLLLMGYLLLTAGLGIFWVANQQLPVFDLHYLAGYATLLLVALHLSFNLPTALRGLRRRQRAERSKRRTRAGAGARKRSKPAAAASPDEAALPPRTVLFWLGAGALVLAAFFLGMRHGRSELAVSWGEQASGRGPIDVALRYHEFSSHSRVGVFARAPAVEWGSEPARFKDYPDRPRVALPPAGEPPAPGRPFSEALLPRHDAAGPLRLEHLSTMLRHSAGITARRGGIALRAAPSSGGLFPGEIYLVVRSVEGIAAGVYHYDPREHGLVQLSDRSPAAADLGVAGDAQLDAAPLVVLMTAVFRRTGFKYRDRAYRYVAADLGHLFESFRLAAGELGLHAQPSLRFDEQRAAATLAIDREQEGVLIVAGLSTSSLAPRGSGDEPGRASLFDFPTPPSASAATLGATGMVQLATSLRQRERRGEPPASEPTALPAAAASAGPVLSAIARRRSVRRYTDGALTTAELASLLHESMARVPALLSDAVHVNLVVNRVDGIAPGAYRYLPSAHALELRRSGDLGAAAMSAALSQEVIGGAAVVFVLSADRRAMFARDGARGYRHAFLETGMVGQRLLLGAVARDLGACPVGAFYDDEAAELIAIDPTHEWVLHFTAVGRVN
jgi:SagB-type dehydrogenase family enzyme